MACTTSGERKTDCSQGTLSIGRVPEGQCCTRSLTRRLAGLGWKQAVGGFKMHLGLNPTKKLPIWPPQLAASQGWCISRGRGEPPLPAAAPSLASVLAPEDSPCCPAAKNFSGSCCFEVPLCFPCLGCWDSLVQLFVFSHPEKKGKIVSRWEQRIVKEELSLAGVFVFSRGRERLSEEKENTWCPPPLRENSYFYNDCCIKGYNGLVYLESYYTSFCKMLSSLVHGIHLYHQMLESEVRLRWDIGEWQH